jgi:hypothetical protein
MGYSYDHLVGLIGQVVDEAINSTMSMVGFPGTSEEGFTGSGGSGEPVKVTPLDGRYEGSVFV